MITEPAKVFLPLTAVGAVAAVFYAFLTGDHGGVTLFAGLAVVGFAAGVIVTLHRDSEAVPAVEADAAPPQLRPAGAVRLPGGPGWPALAALGVGFLALAFIGGPGLAIPGVGLGLVAAAGWLASVANDRTRRAPNLMPLGIPVVGLFAIGSLMWFMSRILLAVPEQASTFIALAVAVVILAVASFVALKPNLSSRTLIAGLAVGGVLMAGGGVVGLLAGQRHVEEHHAGPEPVEVVAVEIKFERTEIALHAGEDAVIEFHNEDKVPHNVSIYADANYSGLALFQGAVITDDKIEYRFKAPPAGQYYFRCDIHPLMQGKVTVA